MNRTTPAQRQRFYERHLRGETYREIATSRNVSIECVRYWCRRQRNGGSNKSRYQRKGKGILSSFAPVVRYVILRLKLTHPRWGPERIRYHLGKRSSCRTYRLPHPSSIGRYLHQWSRFRRSPKVKPSPREKPPAPTGVHQRWQLDFKVDIVQANGQKLTLHTLMDQYSGACITAELLETKLAIQLGKRVSWREAQATLRCGFAAWSTLPQEVQTDGETCLVGRAGIDFPTPFTLWLKGLDIAHLVIRPGKCTDNAEVERGHRTVHDYAVVGCEKSPVPELQLMLRQSVQELTFKLPSRAKDCAGRQPIVAYPDLLCSPRPYQLEQEMALFDLERVHNFLASFQWIRKVGQTGQIQIGGRQNRYSVGRRYAQQQVAIRFAPTDRHFVFALVDDPEIEIKRHAYNVTVEELIGLSDPEVVLVPQQLPLFSEAFKG